MVYRQTQQMLRGKSTAGRCSPQPTHSSCFPRSPDVGLLVPAPLHQLLVAGGCAQWELRPPVCKGMRQARISNTVSPHVAVAIDCTIDTLLPNCMGWLQSLAASDPQHALLELLWPLSPPVLHSDLVAQQLLGYTLEGVAASEQLPQGDTCCNTTTYTPYHSPC
jgi:hypothetical protein